MTSLIDAIENAPEEKLNRSGLTEMSLLVVSTYKMGGYQIPDNPGPDDEKKITDKVNKAYTDTLKEFLPADMVDSAAQQPNFLRMMTDFQAEADAISLQHNLYVEDRRKWLGGQEGLNVDKRNAAMSSVSTLLGKKGLVAESTPMIVVMDGVPTAGTYMAKADGYNSLDGKADSPMKTAGYDAYNNPDLFDSLAALQAIDYICGNLDRHDGNIMLNFDQKTGKAVGLTAIDNDLSFGASNEISGKKGNKFITPDQMGAIGQKTAEKILALDEGSLRVAISGYGLSKKEVDAAWERTQNLQNAIREGLDYYEKNPKDAGMIEPKHLRVVPEQDWNKYTLASLSNVKQFQAYEIDKMNQFATLANMKEIVAQNEQEAKKKEREKKELQTLRKVVFDEEPQKKPEVKPLEGKPVAYGGGKTDRLGVNNPDNIRVVLDGNQALDQKSGANSARIPLSVDGKQGFFTAAVNIDGMNQIRQKFEKAINEQMKEGGNPEYAEVLQRTQAYSLQLHRNGKISSYRDQNYDLKKLGYDQETADRLKADETFNAMYKNVLRDVVMIRENLQIGYGSILGANKDGTIDKRNVAMSKMSELLGVESKLAQAATMQVQVDGKITEGVFMETAAGSDYTHVPYDSPTAKKTPAELFDGSDALKDLADLQILDYVCMNVDRNKSNLFYQFSEDGTKCLGVTGIDNDLSFGTKKLKPDEKCFGLPPLDQIKVISAGMAEKIGALGDEKALHNALDGQGLSNEEIEAAMDRFVAVQYRIKSGQIRVVKDEEWKDMKLSELQAEGPGANAVLFNKVQETFEKDLPSLHKNSKAEVLEELKNEKPTYADCKRVENFDQAVLDNAEREKRRKNVMDAETRSISASIKNMKSVKGRSDKEVLDLMTEYSSHFVNTVNAGKSVFHGESQFYRDLDQKTKDFQEKVKQINRKVNEGGELQQEDLADVLTGLRDVSSAAGGYIRHVNGGNSLSRMQEKRLPIAMTIMEAADKLKLVTQKQLDRNELAAKPEEVLYGKLKSRQDYLAAHPQQNQDFKEKLADVLYLSFVNNDVVSLSKQGKLENALMPSAVDKSRKTLMADPAFQKMVEKNPPEKLAEYAKGNGQRLIQEYADRKIELEDQAKQRKQPERAKEKNKQKEQQQVLPVMK